MPHWVWNSTFYFILERERQRVCVSRGSPCGARSSISWPEPQYFLKSRAFTLQSADAHLGRAGRGGTALIAELRYGAGTNVNLNCSLHTLVQRESSKVSRRNYSKILSKPVFYMKTGIMAAYTLFLVQSIKKMYTLEFSIFSVIHLGERRLCVKFTSVHFGRREPRGRAVRSFLKALHSPALTSSWKIFETGQRF